MDKNTITGFVLIALVLFGFTWYSQPSAEEQQQMIEQMRQDSIARAKTAQEQAAAEAKTAQILAEQANDSTSLFFENRRGEGENITLDNGQLCVTLNTKGGSIGHATLARYLNQQKQPVEILRQGKNALSYTLTGKDANIDTRDFVFTPIAQTDTTVTMRLGSEGHNLDIEYALHTGSYIMDITLRTSGLQNILHPTTKSLLLTWDNTTAQQEKGFDFEQRYSALTYNEQGEGIDNLSETNDDEQSIDNPLEWVACKNQFFSCVLISPDYFTNATLKSSTCEKKSGDLKQYNAEMQLPIDPKSDVAVRMQMYIGPNDFHILKSHNSQLINSDQTHELQSLVDLGWPLFSIINRWIIMPLFDWLTGFGMNMGIVLLLLTIIVKALVYPTTKKSYLGSARMRVLKPQIDKISAKYPNPDDAMKKQAEIMQLYREYGVSPMAGCLPMLIQMPLWIALFNFVPNAIELRGQSFLWADDLSSYDELINWGTDVWLIGDHLSIFCVLFCATNIINTWISMRQQQNTMSAEQAQQMKLMQYMMYIMPLMFFFMFNNYSSGLCYYYFLSGLTSILIMWYLRKTTDDAKLLAKLEAYRAAHKNDPKKTTGMAARLEALQKQMEEQQKNRTR